jgi:PKD repeat protein
VNPIITWNHFDSALSYPPTVLGQCVSSVMFYRGGSYPPQYRRQLFIGDYGTDWIKVLRLDGAGRPLELLDFADATDYPVDFASEPGTGNLVYVAIAAPDVRRIRWTGPVVNAPPIASADASLPLGPAPLAITFSAAASLDPDGDPLTYAWTFGDGGTASVRDPQHSYLAAGTFDAILTVDDGHGGVARDTVHVVATSPPAFPRTHVLDTFQGPDGPLGAPWSDPNHALAHAQVVNGALVPGCCTTLAPVWTTAAFGPDQEAWISLSRVTPGAREHDLLLKMQDANDAADHVEVRYDALLGQVQVSTLTGETWTPCGAPINVHFAAGDLFGARALANGTVQVYRNAVLLGQVSLGNWPSADGGGYIGLSFEGAYQTRVEDFGGGDMGTLAVPAPLTAGLALSAAQPNPARHGASLDLTLPAAAKVAFDVIDVQGRVLWRSPAARLAPGVHRLAWNGADADGRPARAGVVLARVRVDGRVLVRRIAVVR